MVIILILYKRILLYLFTDNEILCHDSQQLHTSLSALAQQTNYKTSSHNIQIRCCYTIAPRLSDLPAQKLIRAYEGSWRFGRICTFATPFAICQTNVHF